ncbi:SseB family protein [Protofrankia symbiont of Coriaria ruscifolia]|uniref:SseB family protein n=1 Tax=Protofrankia symbiont of Coriaria ruscifolia TaxID=1306542 RepID=UPI0013EFA402|nr:SseB family protein [Protofrankia symbiont of Coriaria ruscifolia]
MTSWAPVNDVERRLLAAVDAGDLAEVLGIVAVVPLYLPGFPDVPGGGQRLLTKGRDGVPYLLVFTSAEALLRVVDADGWRQTTLPELVRTWPDLGPEPWGLAVNPATPIGVLVPPEEVPTLLPAMDALASFVPANEVERLLRDALAALDGDVLLDVLVTSHVIVPTRAVEVEGAWMVPVFTSPRRCVEYLGEFGIDVPTVNLDLVAVLRRWPGADHRLAVNPGSPIGFSIDGDRVPGLLAHATALAHRLRAESSSAGPSPAADPPEPAAPIPGHIGDILRGQG